MLRPPPRSPLFPYTTLFRSGLIAQSQLRYLDRRIVRHAEEELGPHVVVFVLERGAASAVSNAIASVRDRRWCRAPQVTAVRSEEHTSELQSQSNLVCRLLLE